MDELEKYARIANFLSLIFCAIAIIINFNSIITFLVGILALLQTIHIFFGDVTDSYRLLRKKRFVRLYTVTLIIFSLLDLFTLFLFGLRERIYFLAILIAFLADFTANKMRVRKLNKPIIKNKEKEINKK